jgi:fused signal recognition particle receptor
MHDLIIAIIAAVVVVGGGGTGAVVTRRRRGRADGATPAAPPRASKAPSGPSSPPRPRTPTRPPDPPRPSAPTRPPVPSRPSAAARPETVEPEAAPPEAVPPEIVEPETVEPSVAVVRPDIEGVEPDLTAVEAGAGRLELGERPRLRDRLGRARSLFGGYLGGVRARDTIGPATWDDLEEALILADVGVELTTAILDDLRIQVKAKAAATPADLVELLRTDLIGRLQGDRELHLVAGATNVWLFVGVNGVGKTTTIGKLGLRLRTEGHTVLMAAGDTFRAAAAEQLGLWAERVGAELVRGNEGGDPGAVIFDAVQHASARHIDVVLGDTAGRLHTKVNLMEELKKVRRVAARPPGEVGEVLLVIDATTGQNGLIQAKLFAAAVGVTGVVLTKLDGTAKGGIALAIETELGLPIKLVGVGESAADLIPFDPVEFVDALVSPDS